MFEIKKTDDLDGIRFADFFSGIGGFHISLAAHGATCVFACEKNADAADVYERNHGIRPHGDITRIDAEDIPAHDILTAGFPCQPFALGGKRLGLDDPRGKLIWDLLRIIDHHKPSVLILENVPGLLSHAQGKTFATIRSAIEKLGYAVHTDIVNSADAWVPQYRERVFITCYRNDIAPARLVKLPPSLFNYTVNEIVEDYLEHEISRVERPFNPSAPYSEDRVSDGNRRKRLRLGGYGNQGQGMRVYDANGCGVTLGSEGGGAGALTGLYKLHGGVIRKLTKLEAQRMAGFPDSFVAHENEITAQRQFGNAVVPMAVDHVLATVIHAIRDAGVRPVNTQPQSRMASEGKEIGMKRSTKRKEKASEASMPTTKASKKDASSNEAVALTEAQEWELVEVADQIKAAGRLNTTQAFHLGAQLARAQLILPPKRFGRWLQENCGYSTKWAKNYTNVHAHLTPYRDRLEKAAVAPTLMFVMATIEDKSRVETVLDTIERGERVTVVKAKAMAVLSGDSPRGLEPLEMPGREGCRKIAERRLKANMSTFYELLERVFAEVEDAAQKFAEGKRVVKSDLAAAIEYPSRHAHDLFALTIAPYYVAKEDYVNWTPSSIDKFTPWGRFQKVIHRLGKKDIWPVHEEFRHWIVDEVHPLLRFAVLGEALSSVASAGEGQRDASVALNGKPSDVVPAAEPQHIALDAPSLDPENIVPQTTRHRKRDVASATEFQLTEGQREHIDAQIEKIAAHLGPEFTPERADEVRAVVRDGYRKVAALNAEIAATYPE